jgi:hypothetical protein
LVRPARPDTILSLEYEKTKTHSERRSVALVGRWYRALGPLPVVRRVVLLSIIFLLIFVAFATSQNARNIVSTPIDAPTTTTAVAANTDDSTPGG